MTDKELAGNWGKLLAEEFNKPYFCELQNSLLKEKENGNLLLPSESQIFAAFAATPLKQIKVVILGQDPYHGIGQANGLCFSVNHGIKPPPSLVNIYKEVESDLGVLINKEDGDLQIWAQQGVFLLNSILTVTANSPGSHSLFGWQLFTDKVIQIISKKNQNVVFLLWGKYAQNKAHLIDYKKHLILKAAHPSPFSAYNGFMGCKHFSKANTYLLENSINKIDWHI